MYPKIAFLSIVLLASACVATAQSEIIELPPATDAVQYRHQLKYLGLSPLSIVIKSGTLPNGLKMNDAGLISGVPKVPPDQSYAFEVYVTDSSEPPKSETYKYLIHASQGAALAAPAAAPPAAAPAAGGTCFAANATAPSISSALIDGATEITGSAAPPSGAGCTAQVELWLILDGSDDQCGLVDSNGNQRQTRLATSANVANGQFTIKITDALQQGQRVYLREIGGKGAGAEVLFSDDVYRVAQFGSWGRVKAYFTSGILLSQDQGSFSQSNLFLGFLLDKTWVMPSEPRDIDDSGKRHWNLGVNSFFETRLTSIPVTACTTTTSTGGGATGNQNSACSSNSGSNAASTPLDTFLANRKTARLGVGVYLPMIVSHWNYRGAPQSLFIAPLAKIGFDTPVSNLSQTQATSSSSNTNSNTGTVSAVNPTTFYNYYGYGTRLGHYSMTKSPGEAPELVSYIDIILGRFSNLESFIQRGNSGPTDLRARLYRISMEGILKVPSTPLVIGFSANVGQQAVTGLGNGHIVRRAGDDLRFLFGARFDVAKLISHIGKVAP